MKTNSPTSEKSAQTVQLSNLVRQILILATVLVFAYGLYALKLQISESSPEASQNSNSSDETETLISIETSIPTPTVNAPKSFSQIRQNIKPPTFDLERVSYARGLISELLQLKPVDGMFSSAQHQEINSALNELVHLGEQAVPAIAEYLESMDDISLTGGEISKAEGYQSLRRGLIDVLHQIGGPGASSSMATALEVTNDPVEISMLARSLELHAPGNYSKQILTAAQASLAAVDLEESDGATVNLLFAVLGRYGDESVATYLEEYYPQQKKLSTVALATLPQGEGTPILVRLATEYSDTPDPEQFPLRMLAQSSRQYPNAREALLELARSDGIEEAGWVQLSRAIGGQEFQMKEDFFGSTQLGVPMGEPDESGYQLSYKAPANWTKTEIDRHIRLIDELLEVDPSENAAHQLEQARSRLLKWEQINKQSNP